MALEKAWPICHGRWRNERQLENGVLSQGETEAVVLRNGWENSRSILYSRAPARSVQLQHAMALRDVLPVYPAPFARSEAARPLPRGFDLCSLPVPGKSQ